MLTNKKIKEQPPARSNPFYRWSKSFGLGFICKRPGLHLEFLMREFLQCLFNPRYTTHTAKLKSETRANNAVQPSSCGPQCKILPISSLIVVLTSLLSILVLIKKRKTLSAKSCISEYWTKGNIIGWPNQLKIFPFVQCSLFSNIHDLALHLLEKPWDPTRSTFD